MIDSRLGRGIGVAIVSIAFIVLSNTHYFEAQYSLMEKGFFCLALLLLWRALFAKQSSASISLPLLTLVIIMGLSVFQFLQSYIAEDFIGAAAVALFAIVAGSSLRINDVVLGIATGATGLALWNLWALVFSPATAWAPEGKFIGAYMHWTGMGLSLLMGMAAILVVSLPWRFVWRLIARLSVLTLIGYEMYLSESRNSWVTFVLLLVLVTILWARRQSRALFITVLSAAMAGFIYLAVNWQWTLELLQKDSSISGRTGIWQAISHHLGDRPFTGFGWARIFPPDSLIRKLISGEAQIPANHSHNDLINWYLTTGIFGLIMVVVIYVTIFMAGSRVLRLNVAGSAWLIIAPIQLLFSGLAEVTTFQLQGWFVFALLASVAAATVKPAETGLVGLTYRVKLPIS